MINRIAKVLGRDGKNRPAESDSAANAAVDAAGKQLNNLREVIEGYIADYPGVALGAAVTVGVFIGWLVKRK